MIYLIASLVTGSVLAQDQHYDTLILHFAFNRYTIRDSDTARLSHFLHYTSRKTDSLIIIGYTDTIGSHAYNKKLSLSRALATARFIEGQGLIPFSVGGKGEEEPVPGNDSLSRRVLVIAGHSFQAPGTAFAAKTGQASASDTLNWLIHSIARENRKPDTIISLADINFIENSPNLTPSSRMTLPANIRFLKQYKSDFLEIDGYCNSFSPITSTDDPLFQLSVKRARVIFDYLVEAGFDSTKLSYKGMGNTSPRNANPATSDEARANMRVEICIYRIFSSK